MASSASARLERRGDVHARAAQRAAGEPARRTGAGREPALVAGTRAGAGGRARGLRRRGVRGADHAALSPFGFKECWNKQIDIQNRCLRFPVRPCRTVFRLLEAYILNKVYHNHDTL